MSEQKSGRSCGGCTACCKTHYIEELKKTQGKWCTHCVPGKGCTIYTERPKDCQEYQCSWLQGVGTDGERPDKTGIVIDTLTYRDEVLFRVWEVFEGALQDDFARAQLEVLWEARQIVYIRPVTRYPYYRIPPGATIGPRLRRILIKEGVLENECGN